MYTHIHYMRQTGSSGKQLQDSRELSPGLWDDPGRCDAGSGKEAAEGDAMCILRDSRCCIAETLRKVKQGFPGVSVVKNPPANAGDTGSIPDPGRSHMQWSNSAWQPQLLRPPPQESKHRN